ncbi:hypothetical protein [Alienimonas chondri]|uniref:Lipoprotein n=1 Tax=Alienimonas chondri TaxID=2681879 RepID=A0ABX1VIK7_9PLAN|nr:hypothetical protein [Alienimonas chondri]NNJ27607.1 hypothetical protein [Alienimonas chondri]
MPKKLLTRLSIFLVACPAVLGCAEGDPDERQADAVIAIERTSYLSDAQEFRLSVPESLVLDSPEWKADEPNPPCSAKAAIGAATTAITSQSESYAGIEWRFEQAALSRYTSSELPDMERWLWTVEFWDRQAVEMQPIPQLSIVVLMDGRTVSPTIVPAQNYEEIEY